MSEARLFHLVESCCGDMSEEERETFCFWLASLCHAYKAGKSGDDMIPVANAFLAEYGRDPLPFTTLPR